MGVIVSIFLLAPLVIVAGMSLGRAPLLEFPPTDLSFHWYHEFLSSDIWRAAIVYSLRLGVMVALLSTLLGTLLALGLTRGSSRVRTIGMFLVMLPLLVPYIVTAVAMYLAFVKWHIVGTTLAMVMAHTTIAIPFVVVNVMSSLLLVGTDYERAAVGLGAHPIRALCSVTLPLALPGILAGFVFAFIVSWDEIVLALFVSGPSTQTLPLLIWEQIQSETTPTVAAVGTCLMLLTGIALTVGLLAREWTRRRIANAVPA